MLGALAAGLPLLCLPQGADQHGNADSAVTAGVGLKLLCEDVTPQAIRAAVAALRDEPGHRLAARGIAGEIAAMPPAAEALAAITRLVDLR
jgi:UDP:flavonoid glycosyltransferase YjiC (YdhE family)